ncbi:MAG: ligand-binding sensor domain-containing protein [Mucilaginibacter sp.]
MKVFRSLIFLLFACSSVLAQSPQIFDITNSKIPEDGLWAIAVDHSGNKWIGTAKHGLVKFDGQSFTIYNQDNSPITGSLISSIFVDKEGNVWVADSKPTERILKFDGSKWAVFTPEAYPAISKGVNKIAQDANGEMYFTTHGGIITYNGSKWADLQLPDESIYAYNVLALDISKQGKIAAGCDAQLLVYDGATWQKLSESNSELQAGTIRAVRFFDSGELYIGYGGGLGKGGFSILKDRKWKHYNIHNSALPDQMVRDIKVTDDGVIWMATNDGVLRIEGDMFTPIKLRQARFANVIMGLAIENGKTVWAATTRGLIKLN